MHDDAIPSSVALGRIENDQMTVLDSKGECRPTLGVLLGELPVVMPTKTINVIQAPHIDAEVVREIGCQQGVCGN